MPNYFLYARKSTDTEDKQVRSIDDQLAVLRSLARGEGLSVAFEFVEKQSAKMPGRPIFDDMISRIEKGEAQGILCWKLDRLSRNPVDDGRIRWLFQNGTIKTIRTYEREYRSGENMLLMSVEFGMANQYILDLAANTKRALHEKAKNGEYPTTAPVGYLNDSRTKTIVVDRVRAAAVKDAFELYAQGNSRLEDIANLFLERGVISKRGHNRLHLTVITNILSNPFYYGHFRYAGELYEGKYKPIISKALFDKVQAVLKKRGWQDRKNNDPAPLCGLFHCGECGCSITAEQKTKHQQNGNVHVYTYYRCTKKRGRCSQPYVRENVLVAQLSEILKPYSLPPDWAAELSRMADEDEKKVLQSSAAASQAVKDELTAVSLKLKRLREMYLDEDIEREGFLEEKESLLSKKKSLEEKLADLERGHIAWLEPLRDWIKDASNVGETAISLSIQDIKSLSQKIFGSNLSLKNRNVVSVPIKPYASLREARENFGKNEKSQLPVPP